jgi:fumarylacetoacetate (FAA) hydrolase
MNELFVEFDDEPIASASIGQVHRAIVRMPDGSEKAVAVKVQYPGVAEAIDADLRTADLLGAMLAFGFKSLNPEDMVAEIKDRLREELDYELEVGVVIGHGGRDIAPDSAWDHVAGLTVLNDFSARDLQRVEVTVGLGPAKAKDFATGLGPWLVTRDEVADRIAGETLDLTMTACVNGREFSRGNTAALHHSIPHLIAQASRDAELWPGDLIGTGTVGTGCILELGPENTGGWLQPGDVVELEIERLGVLRHRIVARP